jgi:hypothetical protein
VLLDGDLSPSSATVGDGQVLGKSKAPGYSRPLGRTRLIANKGDSGWMLLLTIEGQREQGHPAA